MVAGAGRRGREIGEILSFEKKDGLIREVCIYMYSIKEQTRRKGECAAVIMCGGKNGNVKGNHRSLSKHFT